MGTITTKTFKPHWIGKNLSLHIVFSMTNPDIRLALPLFLISTLAIHIELYYPVLQDIFHSPKCLHTEGIEKQRSHTHYILWDFSIIFFCYFTYTVLQVNTLVLIIMNFYLLLSICFVKEYITLSFHQKIIGCQSATISITEKKNYKI